VTATRTLRRLLAGATTLAALTACSGTGDETAPTAQAGGIANVLAHAAGANVVNVHCPGDTWSPLDDDGRPAAVTVDGERTTRVDIAPGEHRDLTTGDGTTLGIVCVDEKLPVLGDDWIGEWATLSLLENSDWRSTQRALIAGATGPGVWSNENPGNGDEGADAARGHAPVMRLPGARDDEQGGEQGGEQGDGEDDADRSGGCGFVLCGGNYQLLVDPYGVIRWYTVSHIMPAALEYDAPRGGLIGYDHGEQPSSPGVPPVDSRIVVYRERPAGSDAEPDLAISSPDGAIRLDGHDYAVLPDGNYLFIGYELVEETPVDRTGLFNSSSYCRERSVGEYRHTVRTRILEYTPDGALVRTWRSEDHLPPIAAPAVRPAVLPGRDGQVCALDLEHANAIDVDPDGRVVLGFRNAHTAAIAVTWPAGELAWTLGGDGATALDVVDDPLDGPLAPHDAKVTRAADGTYLHLLDNNAFRGPGRYVRYRIDETARTATLTDAVTLRCGGQDCYTLFMGSLNVLSEDGDVEVLANPGGPIGEDITMALDGELLLYRGTDLVRSVKLGDWWAYRVAILPEEPWTR